VRWTEFAIREARQTLLDWERQNGKLQPPVPVEDIADLLYLLAIDVTNDLPSNTAGRLYVEDRIIEVKKCDVYVRQRFTIAHEVGHYRLHVVAEGLLRNSHTCNDDAVYNANTADSVLLLGFDETPSQVSRPNKTDIRRLEIEANRFAAEILMPVPLIEAAVAQYGADTMSLAELFDVSSQAMQFRLEKLLFLPPSGPQTSFLTDI
jgi:Zn-dependent peptidase ImmA (M78 family)